MIYNILSILFIYLSINIKTFNSCRQCGPQCQRLLRQVGKKSLQIFKTSTIFNLQHVSWSSHCRLRSVHRIPLYKKNQGISSWRVIKVWCCAKSLQTPAYSKVGLLEWQASVRLPRAASKNLYSSVRSNPRGDVSWEKYHFNQFHVVGNKVSAAHFLMVYMFHTRDSWMGCSFKLSSREA